MSKEQLKIYVVIGNNRLLNAAQVFAFSSWEKAKLKSTTNDPWVDDFTNITTVIVDEFEVKEQRGAQNG